MTRNARGTCEAIAALSVLVLIGCNERTPSVPVLTPQESGTMARLQAVSVVSTTVIWASGLQGTVVRTTDGGQTWNPTVVPGADSLQFRDVHAFDSLTAYLLSSGTGEQSRIYKTSDGGRNWKLQLSNTDPYGFFNCMAFWDSSRGAVYGDAVDGTLVILTTGDGETWSRVPRSALPDAQPGEGGFAASGTCLITRGDSIAWIGTGAGNSARILKTADGGGTWTAYPTPIAAGSGTSGITTLGFHDELHGLAAGGDISSPAAYGENIAITDDGGSTWQLAGRPTFPGPVYGVAVIPGAVSPSVVAVGPGGADYSIDNGSTWLQLDSLEYWSVAFASKDAGWAVGPGGRITKITFN